MIAIVNLTTTGNDMNIKPVKANDKETWVKAVYTALDSIENWGSYAEDRDMSDNADSNHNEVMTAMAWICEELNVNIEDI